MQSSAKDGNEVARQTIWAETIQKELSHRVTRTNFAINPQQLQKTVLTESVSVRPKRFLDKDAIMLESVTRHLKGGKYEDSKRGKMGTLPELPGNLTQSLRDSHKLPQQKYTGPQTSSQEVGWDTTPMNGLGKDSRFHHPKNTCDITNHAALLISSSHLDPFQKKA